MVPGRRYRSQETGAALPMAIGITSLFLSMSLHVLSMSLNQDKAIHRELTAFQARQVQENQREIERRARHRSALSTFLADPNITLVDWIPDHLALDCDTGVFLYTSTAEASDSPAEMPVYHQRRYEPDVSVQLQVEKFKHQQKTSWTDYALIDRIEGGVKKTMIDKDPKWTGLSGHLSRYPRIYALTTAGELNIYDAQQYHLLESYPLGEKIRVEQSLNLRPEAWEGYLVTHTVVAAQAVRQHLWMVLQHPEWTDMMLLSLDISDPHRPLFGADGERLFSRILSNQRLSAKPLGIMHPHHHRPGIVWAAEVQGLPVIQWFEQGMPGPQNWLSGVAESTVRWDRIMAIDRWQLGYPDRLYAFDSAGYVWKGNFFSGLFKQSLDWYRVNDIPAPGVIEQVGAVSGRNAGVDIVQHKRQINRSIVTRLTDNSHQDKKATVNGCRREKILYATASFVDFFIKSPHLWICREGENRVQRFFLGNWHRHREVILGEFLPNKNSMVTTFLNWSPQAQNFIWIGLNNNLCEKTVKIQGECANFFTK